MVREYTATDISPGMIAALEASAARLGVPVRTACCEAAELPFPDDSFDLVFGHAVLHHLPDLEGSFREFLRVLRPGGAIAFCGEPSHYGDRIAAVPKKAAYRAAPAWRALMRAAPATHEGFHRTADEDELERIVDVHAFTPAMLRDSAGDAGFGQVLVKGEELAASMFGWANRALEATAEPADVPWLWRQYAYRGYLAFQALDRDAAGAAPAAGAVLQPAGLGPRAGLGAAFCRACRTSCSAKRRLGTSAVALADADVPRRHRVGVSLVLARGALAAARKRVSRS